MAFMNDHPLLNAGDISGIFPGGNVQNQIERVRITLHPLPLEEMSKVWAMLQTQYRISVSYEVCVVLIESGRRRAAALPVLRRGEQDRGVFTSSRPSPTLRDLRAEWNLRNATVGGPPELLVRPEPDRGTASLGDTVILVGQNFGPSIQQVRFQSARLASPIRLTPLTGEEPNEISVVLPKAGDGPAQPGDQPQMARWAPGIYMVGLVTKGEVIPGQEWVSEEIAFRLAPKITVSPLNVTTGSVMLNVTVSPRLRPGQQPELFLDARRPPLAPSAINNPADETQPTQLSFAFTAGNADIGTYTVRLRVDGAESLPYIYRDGQIIFDDQVQVRIA
jgi:hypothetical protein